MTTRNTSGFKSLPGVGQQLGSLSQRAGEAAGPPLAPSADETPARTFLGQLKAAIATPSDPWNVTLDDIRGRVGSDGVERISTEMVFEWLDVPPFKRTPELAEKIRGGMVRRGWVPVRARHATSKGHAARVRGYARLSFENCLTNKSI